MGAARREGGGHMPRKRDPLKISRPRYDDLGLPEITIRGVIGGAPVVRSFTGYTRLGAVRVFRRMQREADAAHAEQRRQEIEEGIAVALLPPVSAREAAMPPAPARMAYWARTGCPLMRLVIRKLDEWARRGAAPRREATCSDSTPGHD
jgi:hypothetical protein